MPSFEINFEVFCGTCGAGLCNQSDTRKSRHRDHDQVTVDVCQDCVEKAKALLNDRIEELECEIDDLKREIENNQPNTNQNEQPNHPI
jgi:hypothetical protein